MAVRAGTQLALLGIACCLGFVALGLFLTGHPIAAYAEEMKHLVSGRIVDIAGAKPVGEQRGFGGGRSVSVGGLVLEIRRRGPRITLLLDDRSGRLEVSLFEELYHLGNFGLAADERRGLRGQVAAQDGGLADRCIEAVFHHGGTDAS